MDHPNRIGIPSPLPYMLHSFVDCYIHLLITFSHTSLLVDDHTHPIQLQIDSHSIYLSWWCGTPAPVYPIDAPFTNNYNTSLLLIVTVYTTIDDDDDDDDEATASRSSII